MSSEKPGEGRQDLQQYEMGGSWWRALTSPYPYAYVPLILAGVFLEFVAYFWYGFAVVYSHLYYFFIVLAGLWCGRRAILFAFLFGFLHITDTYILTGMINPGALVSASMFVIIALIVGMTAEQSNIYRNQLLARNRELTEANTRLEASQNAFVTANKKLNLLSSITRHGIRNQLLVLTGFIGLSKMKTTDPDLLHYIGREEEAALTIQRQIEFTKTYEDIGVRAPQWQDVGMRINALRSLVPLGEIKFSIAVEGLEIFADPLLEKVFENLIDNSRRHGERVRHISVSILQDNSDTISLMYDDDGIGIHEADKERIFTKGFGKNTGFGLFLTREILAITGLEIKETGVYGRGALFEIRVPKGKYRFSSPRKQKGE